MFNHSSICSSITSIHPSILSKYIFLHIWLRLKESLLAKIFLDTTLFVLLHFTSIRTCTSYLQPGTVVSVAKRTSTTVSLVIRLLFPVRMVVSVEITMEDTSASVRPTSDTQGPGQHSFNFKKALNCIWILIPIYVFHCFSRGSSCINTCSMV